MLLPGPKYGYQLKREAGWMMGQDSIHNNIVYPLLRRFLENKWVTKKQVPGDRGQTRQQYALTAEGRRYLFDRLSQFSDQDARSEDAFHLRVGMFAELSPRVREMILDKREAYLEQRGQQMKTMLLHLELGEFGGRIVRHLREQNEMDHAWVRHLRRVTRNHQH